MTDINLLPWRSLKRKKNQKRRLVILLGILVTGIAISTVYQLDLFSLSHRQIEHPSVQRGVDLHDIKKKRQHFEEQFKSIKAKYDQQSLDSLHLMGLLKNDLKTWALISQSDGLVFGVEVGDYVGREHGQVVRIQETWIEIETRMWRRHAVVKKSMVLSLR